MAAIATDANVNVPSVIVSRLFDIADMAMLTNAREDMLEISPLFTKCTYVHAD